MKARVLKIIALGLVLASATSLYSMAAGDSEAGAHQPQAAAADHAVKQCSICTESIEAETEKRLSCNHEFHRECVDEWLRKSTANPTCPLCRAPQRGSILPVQGQTDAAEQNTHTQIELLVGAITESLERLETVEPFFQTSTNIRRAFRVVLCIAISKLLRPEIFSVYTQKFAHEGFGKIVVIQKAIDLSAISFPAEMYSADSSAFKTSKEFCPIEVTKNFTEAFAQSCSDKEFYTVSMNDGK